MKKDLETKIYMYALNLIEDTEKEYTSKMSDDNIIYLFRNKDELYEYFFYYGVTSEELIDRCIFKKMKSGIIIVFKNSCNNLINNELGNKKILRK